MDYISEKVVPRILGVVMLGILGMYAVAIYEYCIFLSRIPGPHYCAALYDIKTQGAVDVFLTQNPKCNTIDEKLKGE